MTKVAVAIIRLNIKKTAYSYNGNPIYSMDNNKMGNNFFHNANYLLVENQKVYTIFTLLNASTNESDFIKEKTLILDFGLQIKDSIGKKPGELILYNKSFDSVLKDTVFLFSRKFIWDNDISNIVACKKYGILGIYDYYYTDKINKEIYKYYGWTYQWLLDSSYTVSKLRQIKPYELSKPVLNLEGINFLKKD